ncbi:ATP-binding protein [Porticoccus sp.]
MKHGFPEPRRGNIDISLKSFPEKGEVTLTVTNSGVGLPDGVDLDSSDSLGLRLIASLADQLDGELSVQRQNPTRFELRFHLQDEAT